MAMVLAESDSFQSRFFFKIISSEVLSVSDIQIVKSIILNFHEKKNLKPFFLPAPAICGTPL